MNTPFKRKSQLEDLCRRRELSVEGSTADLLRRLVSNRIITKEKLEEFQKNSVGRAANAIRNVKWETDDEEEEEQEPCDETKSKDDEGLKTVVHTLKRALNIPDERKKREVISRIEEAVVAISKLMRRGSLFAILHFNRISKESGGTLYPAKKWTDTEWRHCLMIGNEGYREPPIDKPMDVSIYETYRLHADLFPAVPLPRGISQAVTQAAKDVCAAFKRSLWCSTIPYLKRFIRGWLDKVWDVCEHPKPGVDLKISVTKKKGRVKVKLTPSVAERPSQLQILRAIETGNLESDRLSEPMVQAFVHETRASLGLVDDKKKLTAAWIKKQSNEELMFAFKRRLQAVFDSWGSKGICTSSVFRVSRHFILLDRSALRHIFSSCGISPPSGIDPDDWLRDIVRLPRKGKMVWSLSLRTDGVSANMTYRKKKPSSSAEAVPDDGKSRIEGLSERKIVYIGADPGITNPVTMSTEQVSDERGRPMTWTLTRKSYYALSGISAAKGRLDKVIKEDKMVEKWRGLSDASLKTSKVDPVVEYLRKEKEIRDDWWDFAEKPFHSKDRFRTHGGRKRVLDSFFDKIARDVREKVGEDAEIVIAYGAASFSPSGKGRLTAPTTAVYKACMRHFSTYKQGECRTSCQHHRCFGDVHHCWTKCKATIEATGDEDKPVRCAIKVFQPPGDDVPHGTTIPRNATKLRGLQYCPTCDRFLNRDRNSALCIAKVFVITRVNGESTPEAFRPRYKNSKLRQATRISESVTASVVTTQHTE